MSKYKGDYPRDCYPPRPPRAIVTPVTGRTRMVSIEHSLSRAQGEREMAQNMRDEGRPNEAYSYEASAFALADLALEEARAALAETDRTEARIAAAVARPGGSESKYAR